MKVLRIIALCFTTYVCSAQLVEHFDDGNFTSDPVWTGSATHFIVNSSNQLQLNNTVAGTSYLSTRFEAASLDGFEWEVFVRQSFAGSASNFGRVYLVSSQSNLGSPLNGYYLQFGEAGSNDAVELFRQSGTLHVSVCRATNAAIANSFALRIRVTRGSDATWTLYIDYSGGHSFVEAAHGVDSVVSTSSFLGPLCTYTIGNATRFFFDDFVAGPPIGDVTPPTLQSTVVQPPASLLITFSEPLDSTLAVVRHYYSASPTLGYPIEANLLENQKTVNLTFSSPFLNGMLYELRLDSLTDLAGNMLAPSTVAFRHFIPLPAQPGDIVLNELFPDPSPSVGLPAQEFIELYNRSEKAFHLEGWKIRDLTSTASLPSFFLLPGEYLILTSTTGVANYATYGSAMGLADLPTLNNSGDKFLLKDATGLSIDSVQYTLAWYRDEDREQGGYTLERLHPTLDSNEPLNWIASESLVGGTPGQRNTVFGRKLDTQEPMVDSLVVMSARQLRVVFNEEMDSISASRTSNYLVESTGSRPVVVVAGINDVTLSFEEDFVNGEENYLLIDSVLDRSDNPIISGRISFRYFVPGQAKPGVVLFSEIMPDPAPVVSLPEAEFIEIINHSDEPLDLEGWTLSDATSSTTFPQTIIMPGDLLTLTSSTNESKLRPFGRTLGLLGFPSLSNTGESLVIRSPAGICIDSFKYDVSWLRDDAKRDGGWSLERLRFDSKSSWDLNWRASMDSAGGTPGKTNSRNGQHPDQEPPHIVSVATVNAHTISISFNEPVVVPDDLGRILVDSLKCQLAVMLSASIVQLSFDREFANGVEHNVEISGVRDTAMNIMSPAKLRYRYFVPQPVSVHDIAITEIMADPAPIVGLPEVEYVELLNRSANPISLAGWQLRDGQTSVGLTDEILLPEQRIVVASALSANRLSPGVRTMAISGFPSLSNQGEPLVIVDQLGRVIDSVNYSSDWYHSTDKSDGGWSLEIIDPENRCGEGDNWTASESSIGGTPGGVNSVNANKPDLNGPRIKTLEASYDLVLIAFSERLNTSLNGVQVQLRPTTGKFAVRFNDPTLRTIRIEFEERLALSTEYELTISKIQDCNGNEIDPQFGSAKFALPEDPLPGDVVINEVLFNPRPGGVDFVEIYNQGGRYVDISGWHLRRAENEPNSEVRTIASQPVLAPNSYRVFTEDPHILASQYPQSDNREFYKTDLPSLPDDAGFITISDVNGLLLDSIQYDENMQAPMLRDPEGVSLERVSPTTSSHDLNNWRSASESAGFATPGVVNSNVRTLLGEFESEVMIVPEIISMNDLNNFAMIEYNLTEPGSYVNCRIVDQRGRIIKQVAHNQSVGTQGFFRWDGDDDGGNSVIPGYYVVYFEWFDVDGQFGVLRKRVVVSPR